MPTAIADLTRKAITADGLKLDVDDEPGTFEAIVSVTGNVDSDGEVITPGAFRQGLKQRNPKGVWSHDWWTIVGKTLEATELMPGDDRLPRRIKSKGWGGLLIKGQFNLNTQAGLEAYENVKFFGKESEWSIGFRVRASESVRDDDDKRQSPSHWRNLTRVELYEWSPVLFGANPETVTVGVKDAAKEVVVDWLEGWAKSVGSPKAGTQVDRSKLEARADELVARMIEAGGIEPKTTREDDVSTSDDEKVKCAGCEAEDPPELLKLGDEEFCEPCVKAMAEATKDEDGGGGDPPGGDGEEGSSGGDGDDGSGDEEGSGGDPPVHPGDIDPDADGDGDGEDTPSDAEILAALTELEAEEGASV